MGIKGDNIKMSRIEWIDNIKGIGIFLVVLGHLNLAEIDMKLIYFFHMPLFFFISGYLLETSKVKSISAVVRKKFWNLLVPYFIFWSVSLLFISSLNYLRGRDITNARENLMNLFYLNGSVGWNTPLWFLVVLFFVETIFFAVVAYKNHFVLPTMILGLFGGYLFSLSNDTFTFGINIVFIGLFFYGLGFFIKQLNVIETINKSSITTVLTSVTLLITGVLCALINKRIDLYENVIGNYFYFIVAAVSGVICTFLVIRRTPPIRVLTFYGRNSLFILCTHFFVILVYYVINSVLFDDKFLSKNPIYINLVITLITFIGYYPVIKFVSKYMSFLVKPTPLVFKKVKGNTSSEMFN